MRIARSIARVWLIPASTLPPLLCLCCLLELLEAECPEALQELAELFEPFGAGPVEAPGPFAAFGHETGLLEYAEVLRDRGAGDIESRCDLARGQLALADELEDLAAERREGTRRF